MKTLKVKRYCIKLLEEHGELSTEEIRQYYNSHYKNGVTINILANVLSKNIEIEKCGEVETSGFGGKKHIINKWRVSGKKKDYFFSCKKCGKQITPEHPNRRKYNLCHSCRSFYNNSNIPEDYKC